jgi:hypothetical protein
MSSNQNPELTLRDLGLNITVWFDRYDTRQPARVQYGYRITGQDHRDGDPIYAEGTDLTCVGDPDLPEAMRTLLTFWSAAIESYNYVTASGERGENADLFPESLLSLAIDADDVSYTASWLGGEQ